MEWSRCGPRPIRCTGPTTLIIYQSGAITRTTLESAAIDERHVKKTGDRGLPRASPGRTLLLVRMWEGELCCPIKIDGELWHCAFKMSQFGACGGPHGRLRDTHRPSVRLVPYEQISRGGIQAVMPIPRQGLEIELSSSMTRSQPRSLMSV